MGYSKWARRQPEARSVSVHDRRKAVYGQRLPWVANHQAFGTSVSTATGACHSINWRIPATGLRRFCLPSSVRRAASRTNLASALASGSSSPSS